MPVSAISTTTPLVSSSVQLSVIAAGRREFHRVGQEVQQNLLELALVGHHPDDPRQKVVDDLDAVGPHAFAHQGKARSYRMAELNFVLMPRENPGTDGAQRREPMAARPPARTVPRPKKEPAARSALAAILERESVAAPLVEHEGRVAGEAHAERQRIDRGSGADEQRRPRVATRGIVGAWNQDIVQHEIAAIVGECLHAVVGAKDVARAACSRWSCIGRRDRRSRGRTSMFR